MSTPDVSTTRAAAAPLIVDRTRNPLFLARLVLSLLAIAGCSHSPHTTHAQSPMSPASTDLPTWFHGTWTREWIERKSVRSDLFDVHYLQTPTVFGDVRIPRDRPSFAHASSFADLTDAELLDLARQRGFTGLTTVSGALATWHHEIDFQPSDTSADIGRVERLDDTHMFEHATDGSYTESWRSIGNGDGRFLALRVEHDGRLERVLLVAGDRFLYVRNRRTNLPAAESLEALIVATRSTRAQIIEYLDCEFSTGRVRGAGIGWEIERSTLPWREGKHLDFADEIALRSDTLTPSSPSSEHWSLPVNTLSRAELMALFPSP